ITSLVSISIIIATYISLYRSAKIFRQELKQQSEILLNTLEISTADSLNLGNIELIKSIINQISMQEILITARAYQQDGRVIADSNIKEQDKLGLEIDPLGTKILQNKTTFFDWQTDRLIAGKILMTNNEILGAISIEVSNASLKQKLALERNQSLMLALITASITSLVAFIFSRSITEPLKQMITATQYIAAGDLNYEMVVSTNDELAILARTFNFMTTKLKTMVDNLELRAEALHQSETLASEKALQLEIALKELQKAKLAAESANKAKSVFLSNMSHELRTPLNGILGYAQILQRDLRNQALCAPQSGSLRDRNISPQQSHGLKIIYESGNHLLTLINDILDLSKIEASKLELYPSEVHCQSFFNGITNIIRMQALEKDILFECLLSPSLPIGIQADEKRLRQVLLNLLGNAVKFTDQGKVTLKVSTIKSKIYSNIAKETLRFEVIDTGVGISAEQLEQIFKPFLQVGNIKRREAGTGLGLAISTELVTLMGSKIRVKSKLDKGSTFWFDAIFPVINNASFQHKLEEHQIIGYKGRRRKILVVDDKQQNRLLVVNMLKPLGFELTLAEDGQQEIDLARQIKPDCILTDLVMPVKNGFEAVKEIRKIPSIKDVIIIAISASVLDSDQKKSRIVGCEAFLPKPIEEKQLFSLLQEYLELEWIYETIKIPQVNPQQKTDSILTQTLIAPPIEEIEILYELAMLGSMKKIRERADYLEQLDDKYLPFARKLKNLARGFQEKAIVNLVEKYL
ncbi:MAG: ATP-binding protein, partial [Xenococcaceae cyanobacterium MO_188.B19]|nr:ATP-binding protein [Xenococcaceae cyanobacterium MO_188.B19]